MSAKEHVPQRRYLCTYSNLLQETPFFNSEGNSYRRWFRIGNIIIKQIGQACRMIVIYIYASDFSTGCSFPHFHYKIFLLFTAEFVRLLYMICILRLNACSVFTHAFHHWGLENKQRIFWPKGTEIIGLIISSGYLRPTKLCTLHNIFTTVDQMLRIEWGLLLPWQRSEFIIQV